MLEHAAAALTVWSTHAMPMADPTPAPGGSGADGFTNSAKGVKMDFSFFTSNPWLWSVIGTICGTLIGVIALKAGIIGGTKIGLAGGNNPAKVSAGMAEIRNGITGILIIAAAGGLIGFMVNLIVNAVT